MTALGDPVDDAVFLIAECGEPRRFLHVLAGMDDQAAGDLVASGLRDQVRAISANGPQRLAVSQTLPSAGDGQGRSPAVARVVTFVRASREVRHTLGGDQQLVCRPRTRRVASVLRPRRMANTHAVGFGILAEALHHIVSTLGRGLLTLAGRRA